MTEIDLILKNLERHNSKVDDIFYYNEHMAFTGEMSRYLGGSYGYADGKVYLFGHVSLVLNFAGAVVLTDKMVVNVQLSSLFKGNSEFGIVHEMGVNLGMSLLGDGTYEGNKRIYGVGFNLISVIPVDLGAATFVLDLYANGYLFVMK